MTRRGTTGRRKPRRVEDGVQGKFLSRIAPLLKPDIHVYAIPNGGFRLFGEAVRLKNTGVKKGPTDLFFIAPKGVSAWLETKTTSPGSQLKNEQEGFRNICLRNGHLWGMYRTVEEGIAQCVAWGFVRTGTEAAKVFPGICKSCAGIGYIGRSVCRNCKGVGALKT